MKSEDQSGLTGSKMALGMPKTDASFVLFRNMDYVNSNVLIQQGMWATMGLLSMDVQIL